MTRYIALFALVAACAGDKDTDSGDTAPGTDTMDTMDMTGTMGTDCAGGAFTGAGIELVDYGLDCDGTTVTFWMNTNGVTGGGWVFVAETGDPVYTYSENHSLNSNADVACNTDATSSAAITVGVALADQAQDQSSVFTCADNFDVPDSVTTALAVSDDMGNLAACAAFGHDPAGLIAGKPTPLNAPDFDVSICVEGMMAR